MMKPMSTFEANDKYECQVCRDGGDCGFNCVLNETCSMPCPHCLGRNWFPGDIHKAPVDFNCCYCGQPVRNHIAARWAKKGRG